MVYEKVVERFVCQYQVPLQYPRSKKNRFGNSPVSAIRPSINTISFTRSSAFVSLHCPLSDGTRHLIGAAALAMMKPTAHLINTARGAIIDEAALCEALAADSPPIAGACLDVQEVEPLPDDSPLFALPNVVLTPHIGWKRLETRQRLMAQVVSNIKAFQVGAPINVVS